MFSRISHTLSASIVAACLTIAGTATARADDDAPPAPAAIAPASPDAPDDLQRLDNLVRQFASEEKSARIWTGVAALGVGALTIPTGIVILDRPGTSEARAARALSGGLVLGVGIGSTVAGGLLLATGLGVRHFSDLADMLEKERALGKSNDEVARAVEGSWREAADGSRSLRRTTGIIAMVVGPAGLGMGATLALADPLGGLSRREQDGFAAALVSTGGLALIVGLQAFFVEEPIEASYRAYKAGRLQRGAAGAPSLTLRNVGLAPAPGGGGVLALGATF